MEDHETLQFELESLLCTKSDVELKEFAASIKLDKDISTKSNIAIFKTIQKDIDERVNAEGEISEKVAWFKDCIAKIKSHGQSQKVNQANELILLQKEIETLKEKQQSEMSDLLIKLAEVQNSSKNAETTNVTTGIKNTTKGCMKPNDSVNAPFLRREFKILGKLDNPVKQTN